MSQELQSKIRKIYELVNKGGTDGEKAAAKSALDRLMRKYNLSDDYIKNIHLKYYNFSYKTKLDLALFSQLVEYFFKDKYDVGYKSTTGGKHIAFKLEYLDYITLDCSYAYFKIHMAKQFKIHCHPHIQRCRTNKTKNKKRAELQDVFFGRYIIASKLYHEEQLKTVDLTKISTNERKAREAVEKVEGGKYNNQVTTGLYLEQ